MNKGNNIILELKGITKKFGGLIAVNNFSMSICCNEIRGLIGPNGSGKSTIFNLLNKFYELDDGGIYFGNKLINKFPPYKISEIGIARTFQDIKLFNDMTVMENVLVGQHSRSKAFLLGPIFHLKNFNKEDSEGFKEAERILKELKLYSYKDYSAKNLPYGKQKILDICRALASKPKIILLDEPVTGMNTTEKLEVLEAIRKINKKQITIILVEHDMEFVMKLCKKITVINFGKKIAEGDPEQIRENKDVIEAYLGR